MLPWGLCFEISNRPCIPAELTLGAGCWVLGLLCDAPKRHTDDGSMIGAQASGFNTRLIVLKRLRETALYR